MDWERRSVVPVELGAASLRFTSFTWPVRLTKSASAMCAVNELRKNKHDTGSCVCQTVLVSGLRTNCWFGVALLLSPCARKKLCAADIVSPINAAGHVRDEAKALMTQLFILKTAELNAESAKFIALFCKFFCLTYLLFAYVFIVCLFKLY